ncbi:MAG: PP2C family protein-serine/threonine phosphatase [Bryobacterales bacterium]|nr:PP2C family protein-serine/threonine phosphatase [Bryobacterales bacterium]
MATGFDVSRLEALLESAKLLQSTLDLELILKHLLRTAMGRLLARRGVIAVRKGSGKMRVELVRGVPGLKAGAPYSEAEARVAGLDRFFRIGPERDPDGYLAVGGLAYGMKAEEAEFLEAMLGVAASVISNAQAHEQARTANMLLDQRIQELRALLDLGRGLAATLDPAEVAQLVGFTLAGRWAISKYAVAAFKEGHAAVLRQKGLELAEIAPLRETLSSLPEALLTTEANRELIEALRAPEGSLLIPIRTQEALIGIAVCGPRMRGMRYREADLEFGAGLAAQAAVAFENAWHFQDALARQQLEKELALAASIQRDLFPAKLPGMKGIDIAARNRQARQVGGDYYDVLPISGSGPEDPYLMCVADISGKGISAALLMSTIQATLRTLLRKESSLLEITAMANELLYATTPPNKFATAFLCLVNPSNGACRYVNCGHNTPVLLRASGEVEALDGPGLALGLFPMRTFGEREFRLSNGDILCIYSDGVSEAQNRAEEEFETDRLAECLRQHSAEPAAAIVDHVFAAIDTFAGEMPQFDDITLMVVKRERC